jgi:imidazolonepropionase-like amidohydrolase
MARRLFLTTVLAMLGCAPPPQALPPTGLWDAHVHLSWYGESALDSLAAHGIVAVRDLGGDLEQLLQWKREIAAGRRRGPRIFLAGPTIDGPKNSRFRLTVRTPEEARHAVDSLARRGVDFLKTHNAVPREAYFALLREARKQSLPVASHLPKGVPAWEAADSGVGSIEHAAESMLASPLYAGITNDVDSAMAWWRSPAGTAAITHLARTGVAFDPTLAAYEALVRSAEDSTLRAGRARVLDFLIELTGRMYRAGIPILAGSDLALQELPIVPGVSLGRELELLARAGLPPEAVRAAASTNIARWLRRTTASGDRLNHRYASEPAR